MSAHGGTDASALIGQSVVCPRCNCDITAERIIRERDSCIRDLDEKLARSQREKEDLAQAVKYTITHVGENTETAKSIDSFIEEIRMFASSDDRIKTIVKALSEVNKTNQALSKSYAHLSDEVTYGRKAQDSEDDAISALLRANDKLTEENNELKHSLDKKTNAVSGLVKLLSERERSITELRLQALQAAPDHSEEVERLKSTIDELEGKVYRAEEVDKPNLQRHIDDLQRELERLQNEASFAPVISSADLRDARERIKLLEGLVADGLATRNELEELNAKYRRDYDELRDAYNKQKNELDTSQDMLSRQVTTLSDLRGRLDSIPPPDDLGARIRYLEGLVSDLRIKGNQDEREIQKLNREIEDGKDAINRLERVDIPERDLRIQELQDDLQKRRDEVREASARLLDAAHRIEHVEAAVVDIAEAAGTAAELEGLVKSVRALRNENEGSRRRLEELEPRLAEAEKRVEDLTHKLDTEQKESDRLRNELRALEDSRRALQSELRRKEEEIEDKLAQINTLSPQLYHAQDRIKHLENEYAEMRSTHVPTNQFNELDRRCKDLNEELKNERSGRNEDKKEIEQLRGTLERVNGQIARHEAELEERDKLIERLVAAIESQERSFDELRRSVNTMEEEKHRLASTRQLQQETLDQVSKARDSLEEQVQALTKGLDEARMTVGLAKEEAREHENNLRQIREELGREIAHLNDELASRPNIDPAVVGLLREAQHRIKALEARPYIPPEVETQLQTLENDLNTARAFADKQRDEVNRLNDQIDDLNRERQEKDAQLTELRGTLADRDATIAKLHQRIGDLEEQLRTRDDQVLTMRALVDDAGAKIRLLENQICEVILDQNIGSLNASRHADDLEQRLVDLHAKKASAEARIKELEAQSDRDRQEIQRLNGKVDELESEKRRLQDERDQANKELRETRDELENAKRELDSLRSDLTQVETESNYMAASLNERIRELEAREKELDKRVKELDDGIAHRDDELHKRDEEITDLNALLEQQRKANTTRPSSMNLDMINQLQAQLRDAEDRLRMAEFLKPEDKKLLARAAALERELEDARKRIQLLEAHNAEGAPTEVMSLLLSQHTDTITALQEANNAKAREIEELNEALDQQSHTIASLCTSLSPRLARTPQGSGSGAASLPLAPRPPSDDAAREIESLRSALQEATDTLESYAQAERCLREEKDKLNDTLVAKDREIEELLAALDSITRNDDAIIDAPDDQQGATNEEVERIKEELERTQNELNRLKRLLNYRSRQDEGHLENILDRDMEIEWLKKVIAELNESSSATKIASEADMAERRNFRKMMDGHGEMCEGLKSTTTLQKQGNENLLESLRSAEETVASLCELIPQELTDHILDPLRGEVTPEMYTALQANYIRLKNELYYNNLPSEEERRQEYARISEKCDKSTAEGIRLKQELERVQNELNALRLEKEQPPTSELTEKARGTLQEVKGKMEEWFKMRDMKMPDGFDGYFSM
ncbi:hypothetical protein GMRT_14153 [Giardia muris]|uniref:Coiled-coil protein n=1 Tax=Giardia muris TaxID=5742 RepID=A0A4Z1T221_GIAMU|nr:hypothetical protein GMRT_14153 [Giardia muris]|eukprot:TNJ27057.1 hypothetical protein GMRT_14153 [Giardia muris]